MEILPFKVSAKRSLFSFRFSLIKLMKLQLQKKPAANFLIYFITMASVGIFNPKKFYQMLCSSENLDQKLKSFIDRCQSNDIHYMFEATNVLQEVLQSNSQLPITKFNALLSVFQMLQTATYLSLSLIQIYILPFLPQIAIHKVTKRSQEELQRYFIEKGFRNSTGIRIVGKKYVELAFSILFIASNIKKHQNILRKVLETPSKFKLAFDSIFEKGGQSVPVQNVSCLELKQKYDEDLKHFQSALLITFLQKKIKEELVLKGSFSPAFKKLLEWDDYFISVPIINKCIAMLSDLSIDFSHQRHYLTLFSAYIKQGNIYAIIAVHNSTFIKDIFQQIITVRGDLSLSYGQMIFPDIQSSSQQKQDFYCQFLKCLVFWALCLIKNEVGQISQIKQMYDYLSKERKFVFPQVFMLENIIVQYAENLHNRELQNDEMLKMIDEDESVLSELENVKVIEEVTIIGRARSHALQKNKNSINQKCNCLILNQFAVGSQRSKNQSSNQSFNDLLQEVQKNFNSLQDKETLEQAMKNIGEFREQWRVLVLSFESEILSIIKEKGDDYCQKIDVLQQLYQKLQKKQISWRVFKQKAYLITHPNKQSLSYIQKIKQLPYPSAARDDALKLMSNRNEIQLSKFEVRELQYFSKINNLEKKLSAAIIKQDQKNQIKTAVINDPILPSEKLNVLRSKQQSVITLQQKKVKAEHNPSQIQRLKNSRSLKKSKKEQSKRVMFNFSQEEKEQKLEITPVESEYFTLEELKPNACSQNQKDKIKQEPHSHESKKQKEQQILRLPGTKAPQNSSQNIEPITHNDYGIRNLLIKRKQIRQQEISKHSDSHKQLSQSKILPSSLLNSIKEAEKLTHSEELTINNENISKKHSSLRSVISNSVRKRRNQNSKSKISSNFQKDTQNIQQSAQPHKNNHSPGKINEIQEVYQINNNEASQSQKNSQQFGQESNSSKSKLNFNKMVYSITSRSIQAYKQYVNRSLSKPKTLSRNTSADESRSFSRSIIKKQFQKIRPKQKNQRHYHLSKTNSRDILCSSIPLISSDVRKQSKLNFQRKKDSKNYEIITNQYSSFFPKKQSKFIKNCLHSKGILIESPLLQVGFVHFQKGEHLDFTIFVTAKHHLKSVKLQVQSDQNLKVVLDINQLSDMKVGTQETIKILTSLKTTPFKLPLLKIIVLQTNSKKPCQFSTILPCSVNKYSLFRPVSREHSSLMKASRDVNIFRTFSFIMNKKLQRGCSVTKYLPFFNQISEDCFQTSFIFKDKNCIAELIRQDKCSWHLEGSASSNNSETIAFILSSFFFLLEE